MTSTFAPPKLLREVCVYRLAMDGDNGKEKMQVRGLCGIE
jgi:hypothetical protein